MPGVPSRVSLPLLLFASVAVPAATIGTDYASTSSRLSARGDRLFREARFDEAESAYLQAIDLDRTNIRGQLGMGKISEMRSDSKQGPDTTRRPTN